MLHQLAPHSHHQHELKVLSDHHEGSSHHHHSQEKSPFDFLSILFANHAHSQQLVDHSPSQAQSSENHVDHNKVQSTIPELFHVPVNEIRAKLEKTVPESLRIHKNTYFVSIALRGPPSLG